MAAFLVIGRRRIRLRFFVFLAMLIAGAFYIYNTYFTAFGASAAASADYASLSYGKVDMTISGPAIIIREESVYTAPAYGKAVFLAADGAAVNKDQPVAVLYKESYDPNIVGQLYTIQEKIIQYQQDQLLGQVIDSDVAKLKADINELVLDIQVMVRDNRLEPLARKESQLRSLLEQKQKLLDYQSEPDAYLKRLYDEEAKTMNQMKDWTIQILAPESGLISFRLDGYENILGIDSVDKLTQEDFEQILEQAPPLKQDAKPKGNPSDETGTAQAEQPFFRMTDPLSNWYATLQSNGNEAYFNRGDTVQVSFDGSEPAAASIYKINREKSNSFIVLEFSGNVDTVINKRITPVQIHKSVEGLIVPEKALVRHKGRQGVFIKDREENIFIETAVKALSNGQAIIESISDNQILKLHDQVMIGS
jgi:phage-related protein